MWTTLTFVIVGVSAFSGIIYFELEGPVTLQLGGMTILASLLLGTVIQGSGK